MGALAIVSTLNGSGFLWGSQELVKMTTSGQVHSGVSCSRGYPAQGLVGGLLDTS